MAVHVRIGSSPSPKSVPQSQTVRSTKTVRRVPAPTNVHGAKFHCLRKCGPCGRSDAMAPKQISVARNWIDTFFSNPSPATVPENRPRRHLCCIVCSLQNTDDCFFCFSRNANRASLFQVRLGGAMHDCHRYFSIRLSCYSL